MHNRGIISLVTTQPAFDHKQSPYFILISHVTDVSANIIYDKNLIFVNQNMEIQYGLNRRQRLGYGGRFAGG